MSSIKGQNTKIEVLIRKKLWNEGYRYRIKSKIIGKPDIVYHSKKVVVFIDGDFWHGYNLKRIIKKEFNNKSFWISKIKRNIERDKEVNYQLQKQGFIVIRLWEHEVNNNLVECINKIKKYLNQS